MCNICDDTDGICGTGEGRDGDYIYDSEADLSWCDCYTLQLADHLTTSMHKQYCQETELENNLSLIVTMYMKTRCEAKVLPKIIRIQVLQI